MDQVLGVCDAVEPRIQGPSIRALLVDGRRLAQAMVLAPLAPAPALVLAWRRVRGRLSALDLRDRARRGQQSSRRAACQSGATPQQAAHGATPEARW